MINPVNEGLVSLVLVSVVSGIVGNQCWKNPSPIFGLLYIELYIWFCLVFSATSVMVSMYRINGALGFKSHIRCYGMIGLASLAYFLMAFLLSPEILDRSAFSVGYSFAFLASKITVDLPDRADDRPGHRVRLPGGQPQHCPRRHHHGLHCTDGPLRLAQKQGQRAQP